MAEWTATFKIKFTEDEDLKLSFTELENDFSCAFENVYYVDPHPCPPPYEGPYTVIPKTVDQILETAMKTMTDDVTVKEIPYAEVSNVYGTTVTIAS